MLGAMDLGITDDGERADHQQAAQGPCGGRRCGRAGAFIRIKLRQRASYALGCSRFAPRR